MDLDLYDDSYDFFLQKIEKENPQVLEIGCGPGNITRYLLSKRPDVKITGIDVAPNMIQLAKENNPTADFQVMDARYLSLLSGKYDAIICGFCLPYLEKEDAEQLISDCAGLLEPGGVFYLSTIEGPYEKSGFEQGSTGDGSYVYYYEKEFLGNCLAKAGFGKMNWMEKKYEKNGGEEVHLIFQCLHQKQHKRSRCFCQTF